MACTLAYLDGVLGVREATGRNDGPAVAAFIRAGGGAAQAEWCGFLQRAVQVHCGLPYPAGAGGSYNWFLPASPRTVFIRGQRGAVEQVRVGYKVGFYNPARGRIAHIASVRAVTRHGFVTDDGNWGSGRNAGVHRVSRGRGEIYAGANWNQ